MAKKLAKKQRDAKLGLIAHSKAQKVRQPAKGWLINKQKWRETLK